MNIQQLVVQGSKFLASNPRIESFQLFGSASYLPDPKDVDFIVLLADGDCIHDALPSLSWSAVYNACAPEVYWRAARDGDINYIVTTCQDFYDKSILANEVCAALNLQDKDDRVKVFTIIRGN